LFNIGAADLEADRFAENLFERRELQEIVVAAVAQLQAREHLCVAAIEALGQMQHR
jgi:hypothetical protein